MEPWENEAEKTEWRRVLVPLGASPDQAEVARLAHRGYRNEQIAALQNRSISSVKEDVRILFVLLRVAQRDRHTMGRAALRVVESATEQQSPTPALRPRIPLPELKLVKKRRAIRRGGRGKSSPGEPAREA